MIPGLEALRRFATDVPPARCELCSAPIALSHDHLLSPGDGALQCCCRPCAQVFDQPSATRRWVRPLAREIDPSQIDLASWSTPIRLAWAQVHQAGPCLGYPTPAGIVREPFTDAQWSAMLERSQPLRALAEDVEALLVDRRCAPGRAWVVSIDRCYEVAGIVRTHWRGLSGGTTVHRELAGFFERLRGGT